MQKMFSTIKIKIPRTVKITYCNKKNLLIISGAKQSKTIQPCFKVFLMKTVRVVALYITTVPTQKPSRNGLKNIKSLQQGLANTIKNAFLEVSMLIYKKLTFVGVGYRALLGGGGERSNNLRLKLGHSHLIYYKLPKGLEIYSKKYNKITLFGFFDKQLFQTAAKIRLMKAPEPYKGKGILNDNEKITLKIGKRV